jgi:hypothetical protein
VPGSSLYLPIAQLFLVSLQSRLSRPEQKEEDERKAKKQFLHDKASVDFAWIWFELMIKSLILERDELGSLESTTEREFVKVIEQCMEHLVQVCVTVCLFVV